MRYFEGVPEVVFDDMGRRYAICLLRNTRPIQAADNARGLRHISSSPSPELNELCRRLQNLSGWDLRRLACDQGIQCHLSDDKSLRIRIAHLLQAGPLGLFEIVTGASAVPATVKSGKTQAPRNPTLDDSHKPLLSPADILMAKPPAATPIKTVPHVPLDSIGQAAVLVAAASYGAPFCELCSKS